MIAYFTDRQFNVLGLASTELPSGLLISDDWQAADVDTGVDVFECKVHFDKSTRAKVEALTEVGNFLLRKDGEDNELYTIIDSEIDIKKGTAYVYAEDAGLDLLNEVVGAYEADQAYSIAHYVEKFAYDSGFRIGINEASGLTKKLSWDSEETVTARLVSIAAQFDGCEISFSFDIKGMTVTDKKINIYKQRGKDIGTTLYLNKEIDNIVIKKTIVNIATALRATGGTPEGAENPISLRGYAYDDGDFYVDGDTLKSREALSKWSRYINPDEPNLKTGHEGHIVKLFSSEAMSQAKLCAETIAELKAIRDKEVNYEADILSLPANTKVGDRVNIVDEAGELFLSTRLLQFERSVAEQEYKAVLGEHLIKKSGISQKVLELAAQHAKTSQTAARALAIANNAKTQAEAAKAQAESAANDVEAAKSAAAEATAAANTATESATEAKTAADNAQTAVDAVEKSVEGLQTTITNAQTAASNAQQAAETAQNKAEEAKNAAAEAKAEAANASAAVTTAQSTAETAIQKAEEAQGTAETAKTDADTAKATAEAAKLDAEQAGREVDALGERLDSVTTTMEADFARKTDLTETEAHLQSQISQNAAQISQTVSKMEIIDETANNALEQSLIAQREAEEAQAQADTATAEAEAAQAAADEAARAAEEAQAEADTARTAADSAQSVVDKAEADLAQAQADLETIQGRADATEEEITIAQQAVADAQTAVDTAQADAEEAEQKAAEAEAQANTAAANATAALDEATAAASSAQMAQDLAASYSSTAYQKAVIAAGTAGYVAAEAQRIAYEAVKEADEAQAEAEAAVQAVADAQAAVTEAEAVADQAQADLAEAEQNYAEVMAKVDATEEEIALAQQALEIAQSSADEAEAQALAAQEAAEQAQADAEAAQTYADTANTEAVAAQEAATNAKAAANEAHAAVESLAVRMTSAETRIKQNAEKIELSATKQEVEDYETAMRKEITDQKAAVLVESENIILSALETYVKTEDHEQLKQTVESQLKVLADEITMNFTATSEQISGVDGDLKTFMNTFSKFIRFTSETAITIGSGDSAITLEIDNESGIVFKKNGVQFGWWDGDDFHTGNIVVEVDERAQFGNFAFLPLPDGSLTLSKVGG